MNSIDHLGHIQRNRSCCKYHPRRGSSAQQHKAWAEHVHAAGLVVVIGLFTGDFLLLICRLATKRYSNTKHFPIRRTQLSCETHRPISHQSCLGVSLAVRIDLVYSIDKGKNTVQRCLAENAYKIIKSEKKNSHAIQIV